MVIQTCQRQQSRTEWPSLICKMNIYLTFIYPQGTRNSKSAETRTTGTRPPFSASHPQSQIWISGAVSQFLSCLNWIQYKKLWCRIQSMAPGIVSPPGKSCSRVQSADQSHYNSLWPIVGHNVPITGHPDMLQNMSCSQGILIPNDQKSPFAPIHIAWHLKMSKSCTISH